MLHGQISKWIAMAETTAKRSVAGKVKERAETKVCLIDNCGQPAAKRGCCHRHYMQFDRALRNCDSKKERTEFEEAAIREGRILASGQIREFSGNNAFADLT